MAQQSPRTSILPMQRPRTSGDTPSRRGGPALPASSTEIAERIPTADDYDQGTPLTAADYDQGTSLEAPAGAASRAWEGAGRAGLTPSGLVEGLKGLINLAASPSQWGNATFNAVVAPPLKLFDPQTRRAVASELGSFGSGGPGSADPLDKIRALEVLPFVGPSYTQSRKSIESGDLAGGLAQAVGTSAAPFIEVPGVARAVIPAPIRNFATTAGQDILSGAMSTAGGVAKNVIAPPLRAAGRSLARAALHQKGLTAEEIRTGVESALQNDMMRWGLAAGERRGTELAADLTNEAAYGSRGNIDPNAIFGGPTREGGPAVQAAKAKLGQGGLMDPQIGEPFTQTVRGIATDPRLVGEPVIHPTTGQVLSPGAVRPSSADVIKYAEQLNSDVLKTGDLNAQSAPRAAAAADMRAAFLEKNPQMAGIVQQLEDLLPGRRAVTGATQPGHLFGNSLFAVARAIGIAPPAGYAFNLGQRAARTGAALARPGVQAGAATLMGPALRAAILQRLAEGGTTAR